VADGNIFRTHVCAISPLRAPEHSQQRLPSRADEEPAVAADLTCACRAEIITSIVTGNYSGTNIARCFSGRDDGTYRFAKTIVQSFSTTASGKLCRLARDLWWEQPEKPSLLSFRIEIDQRHTGLGQFEGSPGQR